ncbi:hypothetical protein OXT66_07475 [Lentilactobacillus senioris]|uniref:hypothetical protein n=1 Tax=Lentilactobacillus senioris TaxID=931534 RepID=UPI00228083C6|nr:hypothetical protein [Lentilactobacillus senioris]MCY9807372.1 hypothetical protein [Lentilactobacillus senioris]
MYTNLKLNKVAHNTKNYKTTPFYVKKEATVKLSNGKKVVEQYIQSKTKSGSIKGWIYKGNVKKYFPQTYSSATFRKYGLAQGYHDKAALKYSDWSRDGIYLHKGPTSLEKHLKGSDITFKDGKLYMENIDPQAFPGMNGKYAYLKNGHRAYLGNLHIPDKKLGAGAVEWIPGIYKLSDNFTNNIKHWKLFFVNEKLIADQPYSDVWGDAGRYRLANKKGYVNGSRLTDYPSVKGDVLNTSLGVLYNASMWWNTQTAQVSMKKHIILQQLPKNDPMEKIVNNSDGLNLN